MKFEDLMDNLDGNNDINHEHVNVERGKDLLKHLHNVELDDSIALATCSGAVDGAFFLMYSFFADNQGMEEGTEGIGISRSTMGGGLELDIIAIKYLMYSCFVMGAESMKSTMDLQELWNTPEVEEPDYPTGWTDRIRDSDINDVEDLPF